MQSTQLTQLLHPSHPVQLLQFLHPEQLTQSSQFWQRMQSKREFRGLGLCFGFRAMGSFSHVPVQSLQFLQYLQFLQLLLEPDAETTLLLWKQPMISKC